MRIQDLIEQLTEIAEIHGDNIEVRLATQPAWPFEWSIADGSVVVASDKDGDEDADEQPDSESAVVYIGEGSQIGYLSGAASKALGWRK